MTLFRRATVFLLTIGILFALSVFIQVQRVPHNTIASLATVEDAPTALVLGASVKRDGTPSDALHDRLEIGAQLYREGIVKQVLVTGDDGGFHLDEVATMKRVLMEKGVAEWSILVDPHGYRTYESCKRAVAVFEVKHAIIVTQRFHLARALYLCSHLGMSVQGVSADLQTYERIVFFTVRDFVSSFKAWWDINIQSPQPPV